MRDPAHAPGAEALGGARGGHGPARGWEGHRRKWRPALRGSGRGKHTGLRAPSSLGLTRPWALRPQTPQAPGIQGSHRRFSWWPRH